MRNQCQVGLNGLNLYDEINGGKYYNQLKAKLRESILSKKPQVSFESIAGNDYAKEIIKQTFIMPETHPSLFKDRVRPWQSILLYGVSIHSNYRLIHLFCFYSHLELEKLCSRSQFVTTQKQHAFG